MESGVGVPFIVALNVGKVFVELIKFFIHELKMLLSVLAYVNV